MKKFLSLILALIMTMALAAPSFATDTSLVTPPEITDPNNGIMPLINIFTDTAYSTNGKWSSSEYSATSSNGDYIRYWHKNNTNEKVKVYLYRTDTKYNTNYVSMMTVNANDQGSKVYYSPRSSSSGTYKITIEAYESGGEVNGDVSLAQYSTHPDLR